MREDHIHLEEIQEAIKKTRKNVLDFLDVAFGSSPQWPMVRSRILQAFGRDGLDGIVQRKVRDGGAK